MGPGVRLWEGPKAEATVSRQEWGHLGEHSRAESARVLGARAPGLGEGRVVLTVLILQDADQAWLAPSVVAWPPTWALALLHARPSTGTGQAPEPL